ncbi:E3 ubiquitin-protein ligase NRDP1 [Araneus ventricosus]|uniref:E3 ubiquitin-protein ligase NRDP1 n=1 Tax=Araneus ventricosus TaxID=182803 RepID=A0A4Y2T3Y0_ARAVE|nr:E3 ubiquitin-protein ligase NRDP1 [Araneus ventricosus]GBN95318.1 E3 ubiquitin-protein ligase NRDP1 [Araneus ventricosus]GBN96693.1 E3 ubiquitin-protein ligase NRDP1 [Araneus ventricosus]GBN96698.1 E3 ubiquitin-protein ligase NRDP1 [Araneus ventricosus]
MFWCVRRPLQAPICEHAFCKACINEWLSGKVSCPIDRKVITPNELKPAARVLRNLLSRLLIMCDNASSGCAAVVKLEHLEIHQQGCEHNPKRSVPCEQECGPLVPTNEFEDQNGLHSEIHRIVETKLRRMDAMQLELKEIHRDVGVLRSRAEETEAKSCRDSLRRATVKHWGAMISNPDSVLQAMVRIALTESGCPSHLSVQLMENAHESRWPSGLRANRVCKKNYEDYVCKRIPGTQAVVVLAIDNHHMNDDMILSPGFVMIFAHGVE